MMFADGSAVILSQVLFGDREMACIVFGMVGKFGGSVIVVGAVGAVALVCAFTPKDR